MNRRRARDAGITIGILPTGPLNAITDVAGVLVGHKTIVRAPRIRTGVTAIRPHGGNLFQDRVPAGVAVGNGFGKLAGSTQVEELGELETPILLTNTLSVPECMAAAVEWTLSHPGNEDVRSVNALVGETNDGTLSDIRGRHVTVADARAAIETACSDPPGEGAVGAGTGTIAFEFKGGIGTASRVLPPSAGGHCVGVLVQSNFGGVLTIAGAPVGRHLGRYYFKDALADKRADGSIIIVVATDAPLSDRNLRRLAYRALLGIARVGSPMANNSGDYAIAFSTAMGVRRTPERRSAPSLVEDFPNDRMTPLFLAAAEASEEAIVNSMFMAAGPDDGGVDALPIDEVVSLVRRRGA